MCPVALDRTLRNSENVSRFGSTQAAEIAQLDDLGLTRVELGQLIESTIEGKDVLHAQRRVAQQGDRLICGYAFPVAASLLPAVAPCVVHQHPAHRQGSDREEVTSALPPLLALVGQSLVGFVDERSGLQSVIRPLPPEVAASKPSELCVDLRE